MPKHAKKKNSGQNIATWRQEIVSVLNFLLWNYKMLQNHLVNASHVSTLTKMYCSINSHLAITKHSNRDTTRIKPRISQYHCHPSAWGLWTFF